MCNEMTATEAIRARRSIRAYKAGAPVDDGHVRLLLEAAMMAPSACNCRPWEFFVVRDRKKLDELAAAHPFAKMLRTASLAVVVCARPDAQTGRAAGYFPQDCGSATQNILLQAAALGLGTCWCGVYPKDERIETLRKALGIENRPNLIPFNLIAVGVPDESPEARGFYEESKVHWI